VHLSTRPRSPETRAIFEEAKQNIGKCSRSGDSDLQRLFRFDKSEPFSRHTGNVIIADLLKLRDDAIEFGEVIPKNLLEICGIEGGLEDYRHIATALIIAIVQAALPARPYWVGNRRLEWAGPRNVKALGRKIEKTKIFLTHDIAAVLVDLASKIIERSGRGVSARWIGELRGLTTDARNKFKAWSMPPIDMSDADVAKARRDKAKRQEASRRKKKGRISREEHLKCCQEAKALRNADFVSNDKKISDSGLRKRRARVKKIPGCETWDDRQFQKLVASQDRQLGRIMAKMEVVSQKRLAADEASEKAAAKRKYTRPDGTEVSRTTAWRDRAKLNGQSETTSLTKKVPGSVAPLHDETMGQKSFVPVLVASARDETMKQKTFVPRPGMRGSPVFLYEGNQKTPDGAPNLEDGINPGISGKMELVRDILGTLDEEHVAAIEPDNQIECGVQGIMHETDEAPFTLPLSRFVAAQPLPENFYTIGTITMVEQAKHSSNAYYDRPGWDDRQREFRSMRAKWGRKPTGYTIEPPPEPPQPRAEAGLDRKDVHVSKVPLNGPAGSTVVMACAPASAYAAAYASAKKADEQAKVAIAAAMAALRAA